MKMTDYADKWRTIFKDLTDDSGCYEIDKVNIYQLASHLEELYLKIGELESNVKQIKSGEMTDTQKLELLLTELKVTAKQKTCYEHGNLYEYPDDYDATFDDGDRYGKIMFSRDLLERMGESYE
jgi:hypothetical protein